MGLKRICTLFVPFLLGVGTALSAEAADKKTYTLATSADYPPYEFHDTSNGDKIMGFDIDIANYVAKELGFELKVVDVDFNGLLPSLHSKRADFVMAGMTPTEERKKNADFSELYYEAKNTIVAKKERNLTKKSDLVGKKVGVQLGTIQENELRKWSEKPEVMPLNRIGDIIQELKSRRIDAAIIEDAVAKGYVARNPDLAFTVIPPEGPNGSAIAFPKGSPLVGDFNKALKKLKESGEMNKLIKKWFEDYTPAKK